MTLVRVMRKPQRVPNLWSGLTGDSRQISNQLQPQWIARVASQQPPRPLLPPGRANDRWDGSAIRGPGEPDEISPKRGFFDWKSKGCLSNRVDVVLIKQGTGEERRGKGKEPRQERLAFCFCYKTLKSKGINAQTFVARLIDSNEEKVGTRSIEFCHRWGMICMHTQQQQELGGWERSRVTDQWYLCCMY